MKSIKYITLAFLLATAVNMQAMNNNNNNNQEESPLAQISAQAQRNIATRYSDLEQQLVQQTQEAYNKDMQLLELSLAPTMDTTDQDQTVEFYRTQFYKIGNTVYSVFARRPEYTSDYSDSCTGYSASSKRVNPHEEIEKKDFYKAEWAKGNRPQLLAELPILRGRLAQILLVQAAFGAQLRDDNNTPPDIRAEVVTKYIEYSKAERHYVVSEDPWTTEPISDARLTQELASLNATQLTCTSEQLARWIRTTAPRAVPQNAIPNVSQYLLKKACVNYYTASINALAKQLHSNYRNTLYRGV